MCEAKPIVERVLLRLIYEKELARGREMITLDCLVDCINRRRAREAQYAAYKHGAALRKIAAIWRQEMEYTPEDRAREECANGGEP